MSIQSFIVKQYIKHMKSTAKSHGGFQTSDFSQSLEPTNSIIGRHATSRDGICQALSQKWIVMHAHNSSLFAWLNDANGKPRHSAIANMAVNQIDSETRVRGSGATDQDWASEKYLFSYGIMRRTDVFPINNGGFLNNTRLLTEGNKSGGNIFNQIANGLVSNRLVKNYYVMIGIQGSGGGHCMAAFVGDDIAFFDPNFGEYWFPQKQNFAGWLRDALTLPYRVGKIDRSFSLRPYALKMGFTKKFEMTGDRLMDGKF